MKGNDIRQKPGSAGKNKWDCKQYVNGKYIIK